MIGTELPHDEASGVNVRLSEQARLRKYGLKRCNACAAIKSLEDFYPRNRRDGTRERGERCKSCECAVQRLRRLSERARAVTLAYSRRVNAANPGRASRRFAAWNEQDHGRRRLLNRVHKRVESAIKRGYLVKPPACEVCGEEAPLQGAHADYSQPLEVRWLCRSCHARWDTRQPKAPKGGVL